MKERKETHCEQSNRIQGRNYQHGSQMNVK